MNLWNAKSEVIFSESTYRTAKSRQP